MKTKKEVPRGVIIMTHGLRVYGMVYRDFIEALLLAGYDVVIWNLPGHGGMRNEPIVVIDYKLYACAWWRYLIAITSEFRPPCLLVLLGGAWERPRPCSVSRIWRKNIRIYSSGFRAWSASGRRFESHTGIMSGARSLFWDPFSHLSYPLFLRCGNLLQDTLSAEDASRKSGITMEMCRHTCKGEVRLSTPRLEHVQKLLITANSCCGLQTAARKDSKYQQYSSLSSPHFRLAP
ncbi:hypothetical protein L0Y49_00510, partial [bacterium]|nr:hypothetical protein [bacterium]